ncbi:hypothetical protein [Shimazuella kribbensis]|uniref:hypothetical protein n=1 Tax=Shimazuella kribbensis TaxID=139808 RepID=UPI00041A3BD8|nr:hypothetical protein [Shimazuella kribbensis]
MFMNTNNTLNPNTLNNTLTKEDNEKRLQRPPSTVIELNHPDMKLMAKAFINLYNKQQSGVA